MEESKKIQFYDPGVGYENLWSTDLGNGRYRIESIPFFIYGISTGDVVSARADGDGRLQFLAVETTSDNRTIRARTEGFEVTDPRSKDLERKLVALGCTTESLKPRVIAINVPPRVNLDAVTDVVSNEGVAWEYANPTCEEIESESSQQQ